MGYSAPTLIGTTTGGQATDATTHTIALPAVNAGDTLIVFYSIDASGSPSITWDNTTVGVWKLRDNAGSGTTQESRTYSRYFPTSNAAASLTITLSSAEVGSWVVCRIAGALEVTASSVNNNTGSPNPPAGIHERLGETNLYLAGVYGHAWATTSAISTGYTTVGDVTNSNIRVQVTSNTVTSDTENPSIWTVTSGTNKDAVTVVVHPGSQTLTQNCPDIRAGGGDYTSSATSTTHNIPLPSSVTAGDLILVEISHDSSFTNSLPVPWVEVITATDGSGFLRGSVWKKYPADGTEGGTNVTATLSSSAKMMARSHAVYNTNGDILAAATSGNSNNLPSLTSWPFEDVLWMALLHYLNSSTWDPPEWWTLIGSSAHSGGSIFGIVDAKRRERTLYGMDPAGFVNLTGSPFVVPIILAIRSGSSAAVANPNKKWRHGLPLKLLPRTGYGTTGFTYWTKGLPLSVLYDSSPTLPPAVGVNALPTAIRQARMHVEDWNFRLNHRKYTPPLNITLTYVRPVFFIVT